MRLNLLVVAGIIGIIGGANIPRSGTKPVVNDVTNTTNQQQEVQPTEVTVTPVVEEVVATPEPVVPERYAVSSSPHGAVSVDTINLALGVYQDMGMTKQGAGYLVGNFIAESKMVPCGLYGDGGLAQGLGQWHPTRRQDMPCDLVEQLKWAVEVEMVRDSGGHKLKAWLFDPSASADTISLGLKQWERYGLEGNRRLYGDKIFNQL